MAVSLAVPEIVFFVELLAAWGSMMWQMLMVEYGQTLGRSRVNLPVAKGGIVPHGLFICSEVFSLIEVLVCIGATLHGVRARHILLGDDHGLGGTLLCVVVACGLLHLHRCVVLLDRN